MQRLTLLLGLVGVVGCGDSYDDRPRTLEYITKAVLQPNCASSECHSTYVQQGRIVKSQPYVIPIIFDTVERARLSVQHDGQLVDHFDAGADQLPTLISNLTIETAVPFAPRMPLDGPIAQADIDLIEDWIKLGGPGSCVNDRCTTNRTGPCIGGSGLPGSCNGAKLYSCTEDHAYDKVIGSCK